MSEQNTLLTQFLGQDDFENLFKEQNQQEDIKDTSELELEEQEIKEEDKEEEVKLEDQSKEIEQDQSKEDDNVSFSFKGLASILAEEGLVDFEDSEDLEDSPEIIYESIKKSIQTGINSYKESIPEKALEILDYLEKGGDINKYLQALEKPFNLDTIDLESESDQETVVRELLKMQDYSDEEINETITDYKDSLILEKQSRVAIKKLEKAFEGKTTQLLEQQEIVKEQQREDYDKYINTINSTIETSESLGGLPLNKKEKDSFKSYLTVVGKDGLTEYQREINSNPVQSQLELAYLKYKKFDYSGAIKAGETKAARKWKDIIKSNESTVKGGKSFENVKETNDFNAFKQNFYN